MWAKPIFFGIMKSHNADAIIVSCIDFRFQKFIRKWIDKNLKNKTFDYVGFAGATKDLETAMRQIDIAVRLHSIKRVILIHHEECGAYGTEGTFTRHKTDLLKAKRAILKKYPKLSVDLYYLKLSGDFETVS